VWHGDARVVAVCSAHPPRCDRLDLQREDIDVLALDEPTLRGALMTILDLEGARPTAPPSPVGILPVSAGVGLPVLLGFPTAQAPFTSLDLPTLKVGQPRGVVLTPTGRFVSGLAEGWSSFALDKLIGVDEVGQLAPLPGTAALVAELKRGASPPERTSGLVWTLPADAVWEQLVFDFRDEGMLAVTFRGETRTFEPVDLGLRSRKSKKPNSQWALLYGFATKGGRWAQHGPIEPKHQKQKELLSKALRQAFGIGADPIPWRPEERAFACRFVLRNSVSIAARRRKG